MWGMHRAAVGGTAQSRCRWNCATIFAACDVTGWRSCCSRRSASVSATAGRCCRRRSMRPTASGFVASRQSDDVSHVHSRRQPRALEGAVLPRHRRLADRRRARDRRARARHDPRGARQRGLGDQHARHRDSQDRRARPTPMEARDLAEAWIRGMVVAIDGIEGTRRARFVGGHDHPGRLRVAARPIRCSRTSRPRSSWAACSASASASRSR